ncbi:hypothetical protein HYQ45_009847 [Verticillium longisporum]|uniref:Uncharacterized protein n=2 Tax=Verticillium longisporum TaxID=100787 RepID=A0A8I2ZKE9_VERLO|nr:hypothetical protein HYQ44_005219 [Verticillium longisporum]KAG7131609.1 hypothetical protein HYQ45_009847 [Verticillium longisporum]
MPWLSRTPSYQSSPLQSPHPSSPRLPSSTGKQPCPPVTYIPALIDGACGTLPLAQKPIVDLMRENLQDLWAMAPDLWATLRGSLIRRPGERMSGAQMKDAVVQTCLSVIEVGMLLSVVPVWLFMPGIVFASWAAMSLTVVFGLSWLLNEDGVTISCDGSDSWATDSETHDERWFFVSGIGTTAHHLAHHTLPLMARLFTHPIMGIHTPTYGLPFDIILTMLHRAMPSMQTAASRALYMELRAALLDSHITRVAVLSHTTGAIPLSSVLTRLSADLQPEKLSKLEIFTFGAAVREFATPLGETKKASPAGSTPRFEEPIVEDRGPHIEHFAFPSDPLAQLGVLRAVQKDHTARFCGSVFLIHVQPPTHAMSASAIPSPSSAGGNRGTLRRPPGHLADYLAALFPASMDGTTPGKSSILDYVMSIDRDTAEKRELAAMASYAECKKRSGRFGRDGKRTSWTGLGATVGGGATNGVMDGVVGLEMARRGCRECDGHRGREVSRLADYVRNSNIIIRRDSSVVDALGVGRT